MRILLSLLLLIGSNSLFAGDVKIIAHRGASYVAPENTMASITLAWEREADAVEIDVYLSKDNRIVLMHDETTERTGGRDKLVAEQTLAELRELDVGSWKGRKWAGEKIPTLAQVLPTIPEAGRLFIEIKTKKEILPKLQEVIAASEVESDQLAIICFDYQTIAAAEKRFSGIDCYWISSLEKDETNGAYLPSRQSLIAKAKAAGVEGLDLEAEPVIVAAYVEAVEEAGLGMYVWTVNDPQAAQRLMEAGVDGITTDRPGYLRAQLGLQTVAAP